jgi:KaiC/GvpD/RAD55 family RecA-like ATPase
LDEILGGGLPKGRCVLVVGSPGSGKTTFAMQFLYQGATQGERGLYVTLDEKPEQIKQNLSTFGWNIEEHERQGRLIFIDATPLRRVRPPATAEYGLEAESAITITVPELTLPTLMRTIRKVSEEEDISRIAVDPITSLMVRYYESPKRRRAMLLFFDALYSTGCTCIVTSELRTSMLERRFQLEEFLSQGAILLRTHIHAGNLVHAIQVEKMRGIPHDTQLRPYQIGPKGIEVFPKDKVFS